MNADATATASETHDRGRSESDRDAVSLNIGLLGPGQVGKHLLERLDRRRASIRASHGIDLRLAAVADSRSMWVAASLDEELVWPPVEPRHGSVLEPDRFKDHVRGLAPAMSILVDCTDSPAVAAEYEGWLSGGTHIVTASKHAGSGDIDRYRALRQLDDLGPARLAYGTTVGAGLPILRTLRRLHDGGDQVTRIEGLVSGSLTYIFSRFDGTTPFSAIVAQATDLGLTEPDTWVDISGQDAARKAVILAREIGLDIAMSDVAITGLPASEPGSPQAADVDQSMRERVTEAHAAGGALRVIVDVTPTRASVSLRTLPRDHPFLDVGHADNVVQITSADHPHPLVIQGAGAGVHVTSASLLADIVEVAKSSAAAS